MEIDDNLNLEADGTVRCRHCAALVGKSRSEPYSAALRSERPAMDAGPGVHAHPSHYTTRRDSFTPGFLPGLLRRAGD